MIKPVKITLECSECDAKTEMVVSHGCEDWIWGNDEMKWVADGEHSFLLCRTHKKEWDARGSADVVMAAKAIQYS